MSISKDPSRAPALPAEYIHDGQQFRLHPVLIHCDGEGAHRDELGSVSFWALVAFVPRVGERIVLENGSGCDVERVLYKVTKVPSRTGGSPVYSLIPNVYAVLVHHPPEGLAHGK